MKFIDEGEVAHVPPQAGQPGKGASENPVNSSVGIRTLLLGVLSTVLSCPHFRWGKTRETTIAIDRKEFTIFKHPCVSKTQLTLGAKIVLASRPASQTGEWNKVHQIQKLGLHRGKEKQKYSTHTQYI